MEATATKMLDSDVKSKAPFSFPNGALKKHHHQYHHPRPPPDSLYRECLKNHAASIGGHALDGCGEFMPSPAANPADPTSLKCAACGCHRNFHRRLPDRPPDELDSRDHASDRHVSDESDEDEDNDDENENDAADRTSPPPAYFSSAPHMLLALSTGGLASQGPGSGVPGPGQVRTVSPVIGPGLVQPRKRFRTKFSPEQKQRMHELSEKLGWRLQKRDEGLVEEWCREIGVGKGVFKVWMHNNKHVFLGTGKRGESRESAVPVAGGGGGTAGANAGEGAGGVGVSDSHVVNGSGTPSS